VYLGCKIKELEDGTTVLFQPDLLKRLKKKIMDKLKDVAATNVPSAQGYKIEKATEDWECLDSKNQTEYRSGIGMALYLVKMSRPDIANATRQK